MKTNIKRRDYDFTYTDDDLFESGQAWCPLFGELPILYGPDDKHPIADRCLDIIIAARDLWGVPIQFTKDGFQWSVEQLNLKNRNWPDLDEVPDYPSHAILAARSIALWNHYHIVTNARDYCKYTQVPFPYHWHENDAGILHYAKSSMSHFAYPSGANGETCPLLAYPPESPEEAELKKYERNVAIQEEARKIPEGLVFAALAIAEAWSILKRILYAGESEKSRDVQDDLNVANKFLEKARILKIKDTEKNLDVTEKNLNAYEKAHIAREKSKKQRINKMTDTKKTNSEGIKQAVVNEAIRIKRKEKLQKKYTIINAIRTITKTGNLKSSKGTIIYLHNLPGDRTMDRWISHLFQRNAR